MTAKEQPSTTTTRITMSPKTEEPDRDAVPVARRRPLPVQYQCED